MMERLAISFEENHLEGTIRPVEGSICRGRMFCHQIGFGEITIKTKLADCTDSRSAGGRRANMTPLRESQRRGPKTADPCLSSTKSLPNKSNKAEASYYYNLSSMKRKRQQQLITGQRDLAAAVLRAKVSMLLQVCLVLFVLSLFSSTKTTLVNGIKLQPEGKQKFYWSGEQFVITCQNNNNIKNVKIRWTGPNGNSIADNRKERIHTESNGHRLVVTDAQLSRDDGQYACTIIEGQRARESADFTLNVLKETNFKNTAKQVSLRAGARGTLECQVEFDPSVTTSLVTWFKDEQPVDLLNDSSIRVLDYDSQSQASSLTFQPVKREHEGEYTCQATAVTPNLSKIINHKIRVETQFGPVFDLTEETIWVESIQSRLHGGSGPNHVAHPQQPATGGHRNTFGASQQRGRANRLRPSTQQEPQESAATTAGADQQQVVRVELRCTCQANPEANILWYTDSSNLAVSKGAPEQVVEEPNQVRLGHNVTSTLVVAYNLDPNWSHRREKYKCSATNPLSTAMKLYTIEQGNPPPAFRVGPKTSYSAETTEFNFTLLGPAASAQSTNDPNAIGSLAYIVPPVDSFRIRAESGPVLPTGPAGPATSHIGHHASQASLEQRHLRRQSEQSVQWAHALGPDVALPINMSVKLGNLPSGVQRLYLDAHNAVGYSSNSTFLGQFNLVSSGFPSFLLIKLSNSNLLLLLAGQLVAGAASYLIRIPHS